MTSRVTADAKALFRARRPRPAAPPALDLVGGDGAPPEALRRPDDFYATVDPRPLAALAAVEGDRWRALGGPVWEPCVGDGHIARGLSARGFSVIGSDIRDRGWPGTILLDAVTCAAAPGGAAIAVTNPPFGLCGVDAEAVLVRRLIALCPYVALLLPVEWPARAGHRGLLDTRPPARSWLMNWKIDFTGGGAPPNNHAWWVWDGETRGPWATFVVGRDEEDRRRTGLFEEVVA